MEREKCPTEFQALTPQATPQAGEMSSHGAADLCPISIQIPLRDNDGRPYGADLSSAINLLDRRFGGVTVFRECIGAWRGQHEPSWRIEVAVPSERIDEVIEAGVSIGRRLGQRAMYIAVGLPMVRIIEINGLNRAHEGGGKSDDPRETDIAGCARRT